MTGAVQKRLLPLLLTLCLLGGTDCLAAEAAPQPSAGAYLLMDAESGRVLLERNAEEEMAIASTTKIMTALVAIEHGGLSDAVPVKESHLKEGSSMYLRAGETLTLEALLYGLLLPSGNDAAECIADYCGGGVEQFVSRMNGKAAELGMTHTSFSNPSGLDAQGHYSCALDMARLAAYAMNEPTFARIASTKTASVGERMLGNHNKLLGSLRGCVGLKTGYTSAAGRTLVTCCERDGMRLVAVTLNDRDDWNDHTALYEYGFSAYTRRCAAEFPVYIARIVRSILLDEGARASALVLNRGALAGAPPDVCVQLTCRFYARHVERPAPVLPEFIEACLASRIRQNRLLARALALQDEALLRQAALVLPERVPVNALAKPLPEGFDAEPWLPLN